MTVVDRLAQALREVISESVQAAVERERPTPPPARVVERPEVPEEDFDLFPWCNKKHMPHLMPVTQARHHPGGISPTTFYTLVKDGELFARQDRPALVFVTDALAETAKGNGRDDLLWPSATGGYLGPPSTEYWLSGAVVRYQKTDKSFPRITAHVLRHTAASLAISAGANPKVVHRMLGHASAAMTLDVYADSFDSDLASVAEVWPKCGHGKEIRTDVRPWKRLYQRVSRG